MRDPHHAMAALFIIHWAAAGCVSTAPASLVPVDGNKTEPVVDNSSPETDQREGHTGDEHTGLEHTGWRPDHTGCPSPSGFRDDDGDGIGGPSPAGPCEHGVPTSTDCDDADPARLPGGTEWCSGVDDDCDGLVDEEAVCCGAPLSPGRFVGSEVIDDVAVTWTGDPLLSAGALTPWGDQNGNCLDELWVNDRRDALLFEAPLRGWARHARIDLGGDPNVQLVPAGDVDGDGAQDLWAAQPYAAPNGYQSGRISLLLGPFSGDYTLDEAHCRIDGDTEMESLGLSAAGGEDLTGDGVPDLVVSVLTTEANGPYGYVFSGATCLGTQTKIDAVATFSDVVWRVGHFEHLGDLDGDGAVDVVHGGNDASSRGGVWWFRGPFAGDRPIAEADAAYWGDTSPFTDYVAPGLVEDLDGDGNDDLLVHGGTVSLTDLRSEAWIVPGPVPTGEHLVDDIASTRLFMTVGAASFSSGHLDGDDVVDLLVGRPDTPEGRWVAVGTVAVVYGPLTGEIDVDESPAFTGQQEAAYTGFHVAAAGDLDGDAIPDIAADSWFDAEVHAVFGPTP